MSETRAIDISGKTASGNRTVLADVIPLETPFMVQVFPVYACNFKCIYCLHAVPESRRGFVTDARIMDFDLYKKCIDDLQNFPQKLRMLRFAATGEPLLHKQLPDMIHYAHRAGIADSIEVVSNGALLAPELSDRLIKAGLTWLRISVQGVTEQAYQKISGVDINLPKFIENISSFFKHRKNTGVYIKTIDIGTSSEEKKLFFNLFSPICDKIAIEHLAPATHHIDYTRLTSHSMCKTQNGVTVSNAEVCPQPFYMMQINPDGNVVPCCAMETAGIMGNVRTESLRDIWNSDTVRSFRIMQLKNEKHKNPVCASCENYRYGMFKEDILDNHIPTLLSKMGFAR